MSEGTSESDISSLEFDISTSSNTFFGNLKKHVASFATKVFGGKNHSNQTREHYMEPTSHTSHVNRVFQGRKCSRQNHHDQSSQAPPGNHSSPLYTWMERKTGQKILRRRKGKTVLPKSKDPIPSVLNCSNNDETYASGASVLPTQSKQPNVNNSNFINESAMNLPVNKTNQFAPTNTDKTLALESQGKLETMDRPPSSENPGDHPNWYCGKLGDVQNGQLDHNPKECNNLNKCNEKPCDSPTECSGMLGDSPNNSGRTPDEKLSGYSTKTADKPHWFSGRFGENANQFSGKLDRNPVRFSGNSGTNPSRCGGNNLGNGKEDSNPKRFEEKLVNNSNRCNGQVVDHPNKLNGKLEDYRVNIALDNCPTQVKQLQIEPPKTKGFVQQRDKNLAARQKKQNENCNILTEQKFRYYCEGSHINNNNSPFTLMSSNTRRVISNQVAQMPVNRNNANASRGELVVNQYQGSNFVQYGNNATGQYETHSSYIHNCDKQQNTKLNESGDSPELDIQPENIEILKNGQVKYLGREYSMSFLKSVVPYDKYQYIAQAAVELKSKDLITLKKEEENAKELEKALNSMTISNNEPDSNLSTTHSQNESIEKTEKSRSENVQAAESKDISSTSSHPDSKVKELSAPPSKVTCNEPSLAGRKSAVIKVKETVEIENEPPAVCQEVSSHDNDVNTAEELQTQNNMLSEASQFTSPDSTKPSNTLKPEIEDGNKTESKVDTKPSAPIQEKVCIVEALDLSICTSEAACITVIPQSTDETKPLDNPESKAVVDKPNTANTFDQSTEKSATMTCVCIPVKNSPEKFVIQNDTEKLLSHKSFRSVACQTCRPDRSLGQKELCSDIVVFTVPKGVIKTEKQCLEVKNDVKKNKSKSPLLPGVSSKGIQTEPVRNHAIFGVCESGAPLRCSPKKNSGVTTLSPVFRIPLPVSLMEHVSKIKQEKQSQEELALSKRHAKKMGKNGKKVERRTRKKHD